MKMIIVILKDHLTDTLTAALTGAQYRVTRIASTGGFLRSGTTTMLVGVEEAQVDAAIVADPLHRRRHRPLKARKSRYSSSPSRASSRSSPPHPGRRACGQFPSAGEVRARVRIIPQPSHPTWN